MGWADLGRGLILIQIIENGYHHDHNNLISKVFTLADVLSLANEKLKAKLSVHNNPHVGHLALYLDVILYVNTVIIIILTAAVVRKLIVFLLTTV